MNTNRRVVVLGASNKPERYAHMALGRLISHGFTPIPVHPTIKEILGQPVVHSLADIKDAVDILTVYVGPIFITPLIPAIVALHPKLVILNPGTESKALKDALEAAKIDYREVCTLVLLGTGQF